jgi:hypothetical protein
MAKLWLTYAWKDNEDKDIDFVVKELDPYLDVKFDRRNLVPGQRLWSQIGGMITDPAECDAWAIILTPNSIQSQPCIEELSYALDRALGTRTNMPMFALMHKIPASALPPSLKIRLCVPLSESTWVAQAIAGAENHAAGFIPNRNLTPFLITEHQSTGGMISIEIRPRFETILPVLIAVERNEFTSGNVTGRSHGPANSPPSGTMLFMDNESDGTINNNIDVHFWQANNEASPHSSYFLHCKKKPSRIWFGRPNALTELHP